MQMNFTFPTQLYFGKGSLGKLAEIELPGKKALIVSSAGGSMRRNGYIDRLTAILDGAGVGYVFFEKILPNPHLEHVMEGAELAKKEGCDFIIAIGGGSTIDSAKATAMACTNPGNYWDYVTGGSGLGKSLENPMLPLVAITTTAGTGTEADPWTVISNEKTGEKIGNGYMEGYTTYPTISIVDPDLMMTVPPRLTAYQGFDALFHSTEGYINSTNNDMSEMFALKSISLLAKYLPIAVKDGKNEEAREKVALANTLSGFVEWLSGCTSEHSLEHALSGVKPDITHGEGLIMVSKEYYTFYADFCKEKYINMAKAMGKTDAKDPMDFVNALQELAETCGVANPKMSDYGIKEEDLPMIAHHAWYTMPGLFEVDPFIQTEEDTLGILQRSYK